MMPKDNKPKDTKLRPGESEITYLEGHETRVLRGTIVEENEEYIRVQRNDGIQRIFKSRIVNIKEPPKEET